MWEIGAFVVATVVLPVLINKSTESGRFDFVKPYLRQFWTAVFAFFSLYLLQKTEVTEVVMKWHTRLPGLLGYAIAAIFGAVLLCGYWWFTGKVFSTTKTQPTAGGNEVIASHRPWVEIIGIKIEEPLQITEEEVRIGLGIAIKNHGNAPATNIMIIPQMAAVPIKDGLDLLSAVKKALAISKNMEPRHKLIGTNLFQNMISEEHHIVILPRSEMISAAQQGDDNLRAIISLGGCIDYLYGSAKGQTTFNFALTEKDTNHMGIEISPRKIPIEKIVLLQEPLGIYAK